MTRARTAILISGRGSNMMALIDAARDTAYPAEIVCVVSNRADAKGLGFAAANGIPAKVIDHKAYATRDAFETALDSYLRSMNVEIIALAGFMRVLTAGFIAGWEGRMINIHPSLLPAYKGLHTHERALADGASVHGCSVHLVTPELDGGPVLLQADVPVLAGDTADTLSQRVLAQEHRIYPQALSHLAARIKPQGHTMTKPLPIIIDTDPGQDDAVAILLALGSLEFEVLGITAVAGNVPLALTQLNARKICELAGRPDLKVYSGAIRPMVRPLVTAEEVHGKTGLDGPVLPDPQMPLQSQHAVDFIVETLMSRSAGTVTLCTLGPLTNIGLALVREPRIAGRMKQIVAMGGGYFEQGNVTPAAEFNIYVDPHAARLVFDSGIPITLIPLDCTHQALTTQKRVEAFRTMPNNSGPATAAMLDFFERFDENKYGTDGGPLHDPCVIAWLLKPELFSGRLVNVAVECESELTMGATVVDWWHVTRRPKNATVIRSVDAEGFFGLLTERIATLP